MNKQELNSAFESFNPTDEQKQRMLNNIMAQKSVQNKKTPVQMWKKIYMPACSLAAAALIFAVISGALAPKEFTNDTYVVHNSEVANADTASAVEYTENGTEVLDTAKEDAVQNRAVAQDTKPQEHNKSAETKKKLNSDKKVVTETDSTVAEPEIIPGEVTTFAMNINTASVPLRSRSVDTDMATVADTSDVAAVNDEQVAASGGGGGSASATMDSITTITYGEFCDSIGSDIKAKLTLPADMVDITDAERAVSHTDSAKEWDLVYQGEGNRILTINISSDMGQNIQYFENDSFIKTDFNGIPGVVIYDGVSYTSYMNKNSIAYVVNTNMNEAELKNLLLGMASAE